MKYKALFGMKDGTVLDLLNPTEESVTIENAVHGCANTCRYGGQGEFYSVLHHSVIMEKLCDYMTKNLPKDVNIYARTLGLLHDLHEGLGLCDIPHPFKMIPEFAFYRDLEKKYEKIILKISKIPLTDRPEYISMATSIFQYCDRFLAPIFETVHLKIQPTTVFKFEKSDLDLVEEILIKLKANGAYYVEPNSSWKNNYLQAVFSEKLQALQQGI